MTHRHEINSILKQVQSWPPEDRQALATEILAAAIGGPIAPPRDTLKLARGLFKTDAAPPSDEDVDRWIEEHRMRKYGQR